MQQAAVADHVKVIAAAEAMVKETEGEHGALQKEYQEMCAGVATNKEESRTLTDQVECEAGSQ